MELLGLLQENEGTELTSKSYFKPRSKSMPPLSLEPTFQTFFNVMAREIANLRMDRYAAQNLTFPEKMAIKQLKSNKEFVIKEADKGGNIVLWPIEKYTQEAQ